MSGNTRAAYLLPYYLWIVLFVAAPVVLVFYYSLFDVDGHLTFNNYAQFLTPVYLSMTLSSFWYAFLITVFSLLVAYPADPIYSHAPSISNCGCCSLFCRHGLTCYSKRMLLLGFSEPMVR